MLGGASATSIEKKSQYKADRFKEWLKHDENHPDGTIHFDDPFKDMHPDAWEYAMEMTRREEITVK